MSVGAVRVPIKAVRVPIVIIWGAQRGCESIKHSGGLNNTLTAVRKFLLVDCRGLESALEAVRVSVGAVRVSVEAVRVSIEALRCLRGCERLEEVLENVS